MNEQPNDTQAGEDELATDTVNELDVLKHFVQGRLVARLRSGFRAQEFHRSFSLLSWRTRARITRRPISIWVCAAGNHLTVKAATRAFCKLVSMDSTLPSPGRFVWWCTSSRCVGPSGPYRQSTSGTGCGCLQIPLASTHGGPCSAALRGGS